MMGEGFVIWLFDQRGVFFCYFRWEGLVRFAWLDGLSVLRIRGQRLSLSILSTMEVILFDFRC